MKKIVSMLLLIAMVGALSMPVLAAEPGAATGEMQEFTEAVGTEYLEPDFYTAEKASFAQKQVIITAGSSVKIGAASRDEDGRLAGGTYSWKDYLSSSYRRIKVTTNKKTGIMTIKGVRPGTIKIKFSSKGKTSTLTVKVVAKSAAQKVKKVTATGVPKTMEVGDTKKVNAKYAPANATNAVITFASSNPKVVDVSSSGTLTALGNGNAKITVKAGSKKTSYSITVNDSLLSAQPGVLPTEGWNEAAATTSKTFTAAEVPAGEYVVVATPGLEASVRAGSGNTLKTKNHMYAVVSVGETLTIKNGKFISSALLPAFSGANGVYAEGMYKVGRDIKPGVYEITPIAAGAECTTYNTAPFTYANRDRLNSGYTSIAVRTGQYVYIYNATMVKV